MSTGSQQVPAANTRPVDAAATSSHGSSGEGAGSAMARLISQEQARIVPATPVDADAPGKSS